MAAIAMERAGSSNGERQLSRILTPDEVLENIVRQNPDFNVDMKYGDMYPWEIAASFLDEIYTLKAHAFEKPLTRDAINHTHNIFIVSAAGSVLDPILKEDNTAFQGVPIYRWSDARRIMHGIRLARSIALARAPSFPIEDEETLHHVMEEFCPQILYNGPPVQNRHLRELIQTGMLGIPASKFTIVDPIAESKDNIVRTFDQMKPHNFPPLEYQEGIVAMPIDHFHGPRSTRMAKKEGVFPEGIKIQLYPVPITNANYWEAELMEATGGVVYTCLGLCADSKLKYEV